MEETTQGTNRKKRGCGLGCLVALLVGCLGIFALAAAGFLFVGAVSGGPFGAWLAAGSEDSADGGEDERPQLREVWSMGGSGTEVKVARNTVIVIGALAIFGGIFAKSMNIAFLVALAFAVAASANLPSLIMKLNSADVFTHSGVMK